VYRIDSCGWLLLSLPFVAIFGLMS
jgi:hypothetical protein